MDKREEKAEMTVQQNKEFEDFAADVERGLAAQSKYVSPKYLYDEVGSQLFEQICLQPEYYLTRTEASILNKYAPVISKLAGSNIEIIELGSGSSSKTAILLSYLSLQKKRIYYFPIDISSSILMESTRRLKSQFPNISIIGIRSDYNLGIDKAVAVAAAGCMSAERNQEIPDMKLVLFLGSSIGKFEHHAFYSREQQRMEMHLVSKTNQQLYIGALGKSFSIRKGESIHTENSYKYTLNQIAALAEDCSFTLEKNFMDKNRWLNIALLSPS